MSLEEQIAELMERGDFKAAATISLQGLGPQVLGYLTAVLRDEDDARDVFSQFAEDLWKGLPGFRGECSFRAWAFRLAWHAAARFARDPYRKRGRPIRTTEISRIAASVRSLPSFRARRARRAAAPAARDARAGGADAPHPKARQGASLGGSRPRPLGGRGAPVAPAALRKRFERLRRSSGRWRRTRACSS